MDGTADTGLIVFFDGGCGLCHGLVRFILARDPGGAIRFASLDSAVARNQLGPFLDQAGDTVIVQAGPRLLIRSDALLAIARRLPAPWCWAWGLRLLPRFLRDACYRLVAANRTRIFGRKDECLLPRAEFKSRFLDAP